MSETKAGKAAEPDHPARCRYRADLLVAQVARAVADRAGVGMGGDHGAGGERDRLETGPLPDMRDIDGDLALVQAADHLPAERAQPRVRLFQTAIADEVPGVVRQLEDPHPEGVKGIDEIEIGLDRIAALKMETRRRARRAALAWRKSATVVASRIGIWWLAIWD